MPTYNFNVDMKTFKERAALAESMIVDGHGNKYIHSELREAYGRSLGVGKLARIRRKVASAILRDAGKKTTLDAAPIQSSVSESRDQESLIGRLISGAIDSGAVIEVGLSGLKITTIRIGGRKSNADR